MTVGENIRKIRQEKGLTQKQLGELCNINEANVRKYELGKANPKIETIEKFAKALNCTSDELRGLDVYEKFSPETFVEHPEIRTALVDEFADIFQDSPIINTFLATSDNNTLADFCNSLFSRIAIASNGEDAQYYLTMPLKSTEKQYLKKIEAYLVLLNDTGKEEAIKRIEELTQIKRYTDK